MKQLYLLRHAHAAPESPTMMGDYERILSDDGILQAEKLSIFMQAEGIFPDFILCSAATRTSQTANIATSGVYSLDDAEIPSRFDRKLYLAAADVMLDEIRGMDNDIQRLLVVGHNPGMTELALMLSRDALADFTHDFGTCTMAVFSCDVDNWQDLAPPRSTLQKVFVP